ncbi:MAG: hypothetical protein GVY21_03705 [Gammaproteobacteria bacterium]|jgi:hypothetical protein|nr:hypothetical protein [Gammaproteobacteria bacterium]
MSDTYKLVFRGEVLEGQHPAVVRKRLGDSAGFGADALDKLFSGRPVVVKREADTATAAKFQAVFKKAGARLRVLPVETGDEEVGAVAPAGDSATGRSAAADAGPAAPAAQRVPSPSQEPAPASDADFQLLPAGTDLLAAKERSAFQPRDIDTGNLRVEGARFVAEEPEPEPAAPAPDVSHLSVADVGSDLGAGSGASAPEVNAPDFDVAEVGADIGPGPRNVAPAVDLGTLVFEVAPAGSDLGEARKLAPPAPPDVSHLRLEPAQDE